MTNPEMVKDDPTGAHPTPKPNLPKPTLMPGTEDDGSRLTTEEPADSTGPKPMINQKKKQEKGLKSA